MATSPPRVEEGRARVHGRDLFWKRFGRPGPGGTAVVLHGGPGATHDYLVPFADLTAHGFEVLLYDQVGCGRSEVEPDVRDYTVARDVDDLDALRRSFGLERFHLLGSSYGGMLALAYALAHPEPLVTLTSVSGLASVPLTVREMRRLKGELPAPVRTTLEKYEASAQYQHPEYLAAVLEFYRRHLCRLEPWPAPVQYTLDHMSEGKYLTMNGPNEFTITGTIRDFDVTDRLREIRLPTLVTAGRFDEVTPTVARSIHDGIAGSELAVFDRSSHLAFWEERPAFFDRVGAFLRCHAIPSSTRSAGP